MTVTLFTVNTNPHQFCVPIYISNLCIQGLLKTYEMTYDANGEATGDEFVRIHLSQLKKYVCFKPAAKTTVRAVPIYACPASFLQLCWQRQLPTHLFVSHSSAGQKPRASKTSTTDKPVLVDKTTNKTTNTTGEKVSKPKRTIKLVRKPVKEKTKKSNQNKATAKTPKWLVPAN